LRNLTFPTLKMEMLLEMGFDPSSCQTALDITAGNTEAALNYLLTGELPGGGGGSQTTTTGQSQAQAPRQESGEEFGAGCTLLQGGMSQYSFDGGRSACTAVALEAALTLLDPDAARPLLLAAADDAGGGGGGGETLNAVVRRGVDTYAGLGQQQGQGVEHTSCDEVGEKKNHRTTGRGVKSLNPNAQEPQHPTAFLNTRPNLQ
jgi:hypothetical protein